MTEWWVTWGIWAFGGMLFTFFLKMAVPVLTGAVRCPKIARPVDSLESEASGASALAEPLAGTTLDTPVQPS